jgi:hypothetical protein
MGHKNWISAQHYGITAPVATQVVCAVLTDGPEHGRLKIIHGKKWISSMVFLKKTEDFPMENQQVEKLSVKQLLLRIIQGALIGAGAVLGILLKL